MIWFVLALACGEKEGDEAGECSDGADQDRDTLFDCEDPDCAEDEDCTESSGGDDTGDSTPVKPDSGEDSDPGGEDSEVDSDDPDTDDSEPDDTGEPTGPTDSDGDGVPDEDDCEPDDPAVHAYQPDWNDGIDNDCDGEVDENTGDVAQDAWATLYAGDFDKMGAVIVAVPDRDGDGLPELAVSSTDGRSETFWIVTSLKGGDLDISEGYTMLEGTARSGAGEALGAGDFDDDGFGDVLLGVRYYDTGSGNDNSGWVGLIDQSVSGGFTTDDVAITWVGSADSDELGETLSGLGDHDGDGVDDLALGAQGQGDPAIYVLLGSPALSGGKAADLAELTVSTSASDGWGGLRVWPAGDFDGDGLAELLVSYEYGGTSWSGEAWLVPSGLSGSYDLDEAAEQNWSGESGKGTGWFGASAAGIGDYDGDGLDDLAFGAELHDRAYVVLGGTTDSGEVDDVAHLIVTKGADSAYIGSAVHGGDLDMDGKSELLVGTAAYSRFDVVRGGQSGTVTLDDADLSFELSGSDTFFGDSVQFLGDVDGDGAMDFAAGAWQSTYGEADEESGYQGQVFVF